MTTPSTAFDIASNESQRALELNTKVGNITNSPSRIGSANAADANFLSDSALGRLAANNEILALKNTRTTP